MQQGIRCNECAYNEDLLCLFLSLSTSFHFGLEFLMPRLYRSLGRLGPAIHWVCIEQMKQFVASRSFMRPIARWKEALSHLPGLHVARFWMATPQRQLHMGLAHRQQRHRAACRHPPTWRAARGRTWTGAGSAPSGGRSRGGRGFRESQAGRRILAWRRGEAGEIARPAGAAAARGRPRGARRTGRSRTATRTRRRRTLAPRAAPVPSLCFLIFKHVRAVVPFIRNVS